MTGPVQHVVLAAAREAGGGGPGLVDAHRAGSRVGAARPGDAAAAPLLIGRGAAQRDEQPLPADTHIGQVEGDEFGAAEGAEEADEVAARCDSEAANLLTLNLMHDIVTEQTSVEEARKTYAENLAAYTMGRSAPYAEHFQFAVPEGGTEDPDESMIGGAMVRQTVGKVKDLLTGGDEGSSSG